MDLRQERHIEARFVAATAKAFAKAHELTISFDADQTGHIRFAEVKDPGPIVTRIYWCIGNNIKWRVEGFSRGFKRLKILVFE